MKIVMLNSLFDDSILVIFFTIGEEYTQRPLLRDPTADTTWAKMCFSILLKHSSTKQKIFPYVKQSGRNL